MASADLKAAHAGRRQRAASSWRMRSSPASLETQGSTNRTQRCRSPVKRERGWAGWSACQTKAPGRRRAAGSRGGASWARPVKEGRFSARRPGRLRHRFGGGACLAGRYQMPTLTPGRAQARPPKSARGTGRRRGGSRRRFARGQEGRSRVTVWKPSKRNDYRPSCRRSLRARSAAGRSQSSSDAAEHGAVAHGVQVALERRLAAVETGSLWVTTGRLSRPCAAACQAP